MSASSAVVTPPRRGRGSRGGGLNRGRRLGLKLKRLEGGAAGDFGVVSGGRGSRSRGGGRGRPRGSAAAAMAAAYSASDYHMNLYLQQQQQQAAVAGGGDFGRLGGGGSSGLLGFPGGCSSSSPGCGGLEDGGESADEQFYAEAYPGKLCALCNLSERSFLGQGEMVRYTVVASEVNLEEYALKRKAAAMETESSGGAAESGGRKSPTTATTPFASPSSPSSSEITITSEGRLGGRGLLGACGRKGLWRKFGGKPGRRGGGGRVKLEL